MSSLPKLQLMNEPQMQHYSDERVEDYLEHLCSPLIGVVPYPDRKAFRREVHAHLDGLIQEYVWQGQGLREATEAALREFGEPWKVGNAFLQEWMQGSPTVRPAILTRKATFTAFAWFGTASMLTLLLLEQLPLASSQGTLILMIGLLAFLTPFMAGSLVGTMSPAQSERGVRNSVLLLVLHSLVTGLLLLPRYDGLIFAGWQMLFWLPAGRVSAGMTANYLRNLRRRRFWHAAPQS